MTLQTSVPTLLVDNQPASAQARELLEQAGFRVVVKTVPAYHPEAVAHGLPVLFGLSAAFEGVEGVQIFIENATLLHYPRNPEPPQA